MIDFQAEPAKVAGYTNFRDVAADDGDDDSLYGNEIVDDGTGGFKIGGIP